MSRVLIVNPNTSETVTRWLAEEARRLAPAGVEIIAVNAASGLEALQKLQDLETAGHAVVQAIEAQGTLQGAVIAAFGDPGLATARARFSLPIVGLGECGIHAAGAGGRRFSILTLGAPMREPIMARAAALGFADKLVEVVVLPFSIGEMIAERDAKRAQIADAVSRCHGEAVLLGGAPFVGMARALAIETHKSVLDGVEACLAAIMIAKGAVSEGAPYPPGAPPS
jgi:Asp/Glu/hydantoin racemase